MIVSITIPSEMRDSDALDCLVNAAAVAEKLLPASTTLSPPPLSSQSFSPTISSQKSKHKSRPSTKAPRDHRPAYSQEEADAILYLRDSVQLSWKQVVKAWNNLFDALTGEFWGPRTISGLQSHYYRIIETEKGAGRRPSAPNPDNGLLKSTDRRYWWCYGTSPSVMNEISAATVEERKLALKQNVRRLRREAHKEGRQRKLARRIIQGHDDVKHEKESELDLVTGVPDHGSKHGREGSVSSMVESFEHQSISDGEGYESSSFSAIMSQTSSQTSAPPSSPSPSFEVRKLQFSPEPTTSNPSALPSFQMLEDWADKGANKSDSNGNQVVRWQERVQALQQRPEKETTPVEPRPVTKNRMAVENLLTC